jgi:type II secretory pathway pseudopilin PulG
MRKGAAGFTLVEVTIILLVLVVLGAILLPVIGNFIIKAKIVRVREDCGALGVTLQMMLLDIGEACFWQVGHGDSLDDPPSRCAANRVNLLVGDGDIPGLATGSLGGEVMNQNWTRAVNFADVDLLENHIVANRPGGKASNRYRSPADIMMPPLTQGNEGGMDFANPSSSGFNAEFAWRGAYMTGPIEADPWGNRYMVNVQFLDFSPLNYMHRAFDVFILSAGANEYTETPFAQDGAITGGDDFIYVISGGAY